MTEFFKQLVSLITDKTTSWGFKTALFISIIFLIFVCDFYLGFSSNYHLNNKIEQLEKIKSLKIKYDKDSINTLELNKIEKRIFETTHYSERLSLLFLKDSIKSEKSNIIEQNNPTNNKPNITTKTPIFSLFWMSLTSNYLLFIMLPFLLFLPLYHKGTRTGNGLLGMFATIIVILGMISISTLVAYQIPLILNNPFWNYCLNFIIHTLFWLIFYFIGKKQQKNINNAHKELS
tara:strand:+ start:170 stop:868 length:699 start_codon:yes stop_codon:yes gene_type:complete